MNDLKIRNLTLAFPKTERPFMEIDSFSLEAGASLCLTGASGSGKSTLVFLLSALDRPTSGSIEWGGFSISEAREKERDRWRRENLGLVFQDFQLISGLSAFENVTLPCTFSSFHVPQKDAERAKELLDRFSVPHPEREVSLMSRGEQQRVAVARALLKRPGIIIADEPTASLDRENEEAVSSLLLETAESLGSTLVVSTHQAWFKERADVVLTLSHGRIEKEERR